MSLVPANNPIELLRGFTWEQLITLWKNTAHTEAWPLTNWKVEFVILNGTTALLTLTEGSGVTIVSAPNGEIEITITNTQTGSLPESGRERVSLNYYVKLTKSTGNKEVWCPLKGEVTAAVP